MINNKRMEWLDAMRGFTMILVVIYHVAHVSFGINDKHSSVQPLLVLFRMPLFFLVSGFLAYKVDRVWTSRLLGSTLLGKCKVQLIPTVVFLCVNILLLHSKTNFFTYLEGVMAIPTKGGYWFTIVLLQMFIIYYVYDFFTSRLQKKLRVFAMPLLWLLSFSLYVVMYMPPVMKQLSPEFRQALDTTSFIQTMHYMHFFVFGNILHQYWDKVQRLMDTKWLFFVLVVFAFVSAGDVLKWHNLRLMWTNVPRTIASYTLMMIVVMFFRYYKDWFVKEKVVGRSLQYIGTRTLDIYLLHFMFLPTLPMVGAWFESHRNNFVLDFSLCFVVAMVVIAFCLVTSNLLRVNPILSEYLFGRPTPALPVSEVVVSEEGQSQGQSQS